MCSYKLARFFQPKELDSSRHWLTVCVGRASAWFCVRVWKCPTYTFDRTSLTFFFTDFRVFMFFLLYVTYTVLGDCIMCLYAFYALINFKCVWDCITFYFKTILFLLLTINGIKYKSDIFNILLLCYIQHMTKLYIFFFRA